jgi:hypothetical protein
MNARPAPEFSEWSRYDETDREALIRALEYSFESESADRDGAENPPSRTGAARALDLAMQCMMDVYRGFLGLG